MTDVVAKLWGFCHTLRHDGIGYGHYVEQLTYLLFLKMAGERRIDLPAKTDWVYLRDLSGTELLDGYADALRVLGRQSGVLGQIFKQAQSQFRTPVNLKKLIDLIDETDWTQLDVDVKAAAFEGLLERAASEGKKGAGQYFTPRPLIRTMVRCVRPDPRGNRDFTIDDPACGTGGFLVAAYEWLLAESKGRLDRDVAKRIRTQTYYGQDIAIEPCRLAAMNLYLHRVEPHITDKDSVADPPGSRRYDVVLTNPPFGTKGANQAPERDDFVVRTSNKQLNFIQHVLTILKPGGRASIVVPDNVLFAEQAGEVFKVLTEDCDVHTVLRLPHGTFSPYTEGTKTNVLFFTKGRPTEQTWIYDGRTNVPSVTKKERPLSEEHFTEFLRCYGAEPVAPAARSESDAPSGRWRRFDIGELRAQGYKLIAFRWIRDESLDASDVVADPPELITGATEALQLALDGLSEMERALEWNGWRPAAVAALPNGDSILSQLAVAKSRVGRFRRAVLAAACSGALTSDWREEHPDAPAAKVPDLGARKVTSERKRAVEGFDGSGLPELPETWRWAPLAAVAEGVLGKMLDRAKNKGTLQPYLRNINVRWRGFDLRDVQQMRFEPDEEARYGLLPGDVLVCEGGEPGRAAVWREGGSSMRFQKAVHRVRPDAALIADWLVDVLEAHGYSGVLQEYFTGTGISHLTGESLAKVPVPLPPLPEQAELVRRIDYLLTRVGDIERRD